MDKINEIVEEGLKRLEHFYKIFGEERTSKKESIIKSDNNCFFKDGPTVHKKINLVKEENLQKPIVQYYRLSENFCLDFATSPLGKKIRFKELMAKNIIEKIKDLTGEEIKVNLKSKKNVIRHAILILQKYNYKIN